MYLQCPRPIKRCKKISDKEQEKTFFLLTLPLLTSFKDIFFPEISTVCSFSELSQWGFDRDITKSFFNEESISSHNSHTPSTTIGHNLIVISLATCVNVLCQFRYW